LHVHTLDVSLESFVGTDVRLKPYLKLLNNLSFHLYLDSVDTDFFSQHHFFFLVLDDLFVNLNHNARVGKELSIQNTLLVHIFTELKQVLLSFFLKLLKLLIRTLSLG
jgi:hypothetical protein